MVAILPVVIGTLAALYVSFMNPAVPTGLQELSTVAISGIGSVGATVYALQAVVRGHRHANLRGALQFMTPSLYSFNRQVLATLPSVLGVLDEIAPSSGLLALAATNVLTSSEVVAPYIGGVLDTLALTEAKARMWVKPRAVDFDLEPWFEWQPAPEAGDSILCGQDEMNFRLTCYRLPRHVSRFVHSLDVYRPDATSLAVFNPTLSLPTCLDLEVSYLHRSSMRSAAIFGQENRVLTIMGRVILVQPYPLQVSLTCSGSNAACSLGSYRHGTKALHTLPSQWARFIFCAFAAVFCILVVRILVHRDLGAPGVASDPVYMTFQPVYSLALKDMKNVQGEEPKCWSLIPLPLDAKYNGFEHDQGPDDDVSGTCASASHVVDTVADPPSSVTITTPGTPEAESEDSDSTTTRSTDPASVPLPDSEDDDFGLAEDATTVALAVDPATIPLPPDDGLWDTDAELEFPSCSDQSDSILSADLDSSDSLLSDVQTEESSGLGSLSMSEDQSAEFGGAPRFLVEDGTGGASVSASTSLDSDILGELGDAAQEGPAGDARNDNGADGTLDTSVSMNIGNAGMGASTSLDTPGPNTPPIEAAGTSEFPTEDSLDLNLIIESRSQLLDVDLKDLADSGSELVPDVDWDEEKVVVAIPNALTTAPPVSSGFDRSFPRVSVFPNLPTIAEETFGSLANVSPDTTAWELGMPATPIPAEDSMDLKLDTTGSRLMDADFGESEDTSNDFGESVDGSFPRVSAFPNLPTIAEESFGSLADISPDTTAWELGMPQTQATSAPAEDSMDLKLEITGSPLLDADFGELEDMSDDFGESTMAGSAGPVGLLGTNIPTNARSTNDNDNTEDSVDTILDATRGEQAESY